MNISKLHIHKYIFSASFQRKTRTKILSFFVLIFLFLGNTAIAADNSTLEQQKRDAQNKLNQTTSQKLTLAAQISAFDEQVNALQFQINTTQAELNVLNQKITKTNEEIAKIEVEISAKKKLLGEYLKTMYINGQTSQMELILTSENFSDFVDQGEYLRTVQASIDEALQQIEDAKTKLEAEKKALKEAETKALALKEEQVSKQAALQSQVAAKQALLVATQGEENRYKALINNIQGQIDSNNARTWNGPMASYGHVNKGDVIGYIGNSGYSTGPHLHFEIRDGNKNTLNPDNYINNGYFGDPAPGVGTNVPYGYSSSYFPGVFHTGIDKADGGRGTPIRAVAPGEIVLRVSGRPNTYPGSLEYGNYVMIRHTNGMYSLYGHMR